MTSNLILALILLLGGALQTIPAQGGIPPYEPAHNIAVGPDTRAAQISDHRLATTGNPAQFIYLPWDCPDGCARHDQARSLSSRPTGLGGSVAEVKLSIDRESGNDIGFCRRRFYTAAVYRTGHRRVIHLHEMVFRRMGAMAQDHLTSSKLGGVLYYSNGRRWLPDERSSEAHQRAAEIHDDRRPGIPRDCDRHECMFGTGILSSTRNVYSKYSDRGISLRDSYCQADCIVSYTRICPPQQIINYHKIPNSEQSIYSRLFYGLAGLDMGLILGKEVSHV